MDRAKLSDPIMRRRGVIPKRLRQRVKSVLRYPLTLRLVADARSFVAFRRVENTTRRWPAGSVPVGVRLRALAGHEVALRPHTADNLALIGTFMGRHHLPPPEAAVDPRLIWDLGSNIGLTVADLACAYPSATIVGVELDDANAELARRNTAAWSDRCEVLRGAVWTEDGVVTYTRPPGDEQGFHIDDSAGSGAPHADAPAITLDGLLARVRGDVDYVKMDIEGAEREVLRNNTAWAARVRSIKVEVHPPYSVEECMADLSELGFRAQRGEGHPALVVGVR
jgi:FkbM family methyltransferase